MYIRRSKYNKTILGSNRVCEIIELKSVLPTEYRKKCPPTFVLIVRKLLSTSEADKLYAQQQGIKWDDTIRKKVLTKRRRHNLMYSDESQEPDYENNKGRIVAWENVPCLKAAIDRVKTFGGKVEQIVCEGNKYKKFERSTNVGIGRHGDSERKKVICGEVWSKHGSQI